MIQASPTRQCIRLSSVSVCHLEGSVVKKFVAVATAIAAFGFVNSASAADMPTKAPAPMMAPVYNWTGFYVGANAGYAWGRASTATVSPGLPFSAPPADAIYSAAESPNVNTRGF